MRKRAYRAVPVNRLDLDRLLHGRDGLPVTLGTDTGKFELLVVCRWPDRHFERPWRVRNPSEIPALLAVLQRLGQGRQVVVALESSGTYGDALRQALADHGIAPP